MSLTLPSPNDVAGDREKVVGRNQGGRRNRGSLVNNGGLDEALDTLNRGAINDSAQRPDGIGPVQNVAADRSVLHDDTGRHNHILRGTSQLLQNEINHLAQRGVLVLEQLGDTEEESGGFVRGELLPGEEEDRDLGQ